MIMSILVPALGYVNPYIRQSSANIRPIFFNSVRLGNVETNKAQSASNTARIVARVNLERHSSGLAPATRKVSSEL